MTAATIVSMIAALGLGAPIAVLITTFFNRRKTATDGAAVVQGMAIDYAKEVNAQLKELRAELASAQAKITALEAKVDAAEERAAKAERARDTLISSWPAGQALPAVH